LKSSQPCTVLGNACSITPCPLRHPIGQTRPKTYNSGDSPVVTHLTTNPPVSCLSTAERTGSAGRQDPMVVCEEIVISTIIIPIIRVSRHMRHRLALNICDQIPALKVLIGGETFSSETSPLPSNGESPTHHEPRPYGDENRLEVMTE
jgi:hypothetical protein